MAMKRNLYSALRLCLMALVGGVLVGVLTIPPTPTPFRPPEPTPQSSPLDLFEVTHTANMKSGRDGIPTPLVVATVPGGFRPASKVHAFSPEGHWCLDIDKNAARLVETATGKEVTRIKEYLGALPGRGFKPRFDPVRGLVDVDMSGMFSSYDHLIVTGMAMAPHGKHLIFVGRREVRDRLARVLGNGPEKQSFPWLHAWTWDEDGLKPGEILCQETGSPPTVLAVSSTGLLAVSHGDGEVRLLDVHRHYPSKVTAFSVPGGKVAALAFSPEGRMLAVGDGERVHFFDLALTASSGRRLLPTWIGLGVCLGVLALCAVALWRKPAESGWRGRAWVRSVCHACLGGLVVTLVLLVVRWEVVPEPIDAGTLDVAGPVLRLVYSPEGDRLLIQHTKRDLLVVDAGGHQTTHAAVLGFEPGWIGFAPEGRHLLMHDERGATQVLRLKAFDGKGDILARCEAALAESPNDATARLGRAQAYLARGRLDEALADLDRILEKEPRNALAHFHHGQVLVEKGEYARARAAFERAVQYDRTLGR
jgi:hypothetical protein